MTASNIFISLKPNSTPLARPLQCIFTAFTITTNVITNLDFNYNEKKMRMLFDITHVRQQCVKRPKSCVAELQVHQLKNCGIISFRWESLENHAKHRQAVSTKRSSGHKLQLQNEDIGVFSSITSCALHLVTFLYCNCCLCSVLHLHFYRHRHFLAAPCSDAISSLDLIQTLH